MENQENNNHAAETPKTDLSAMILGHIEGIKQIYEDAAKKTEEHHKRVVSLYEDRIGILESQILLLQGQVKHKSGLLDIALKALNPVKQTA